MKPKELPPIEVLQEILTYCPESGEIRWSKKMAQFTKVGEVAGYKDQAGYIKIQINYNSYYAHRIAWALAYGEYPDLPIDHINGQPCDNRLSNLRVASYSENCLNRKRSSNNTSGHRGVFKNRNKWVARITINGKVIHLGMYVRVEDAIAARLKAEEENKIFVRD